MEGWQIGGDFQEVELQHCPCLAFYCQKDKSNGSYGRQLKPSSAGLKLLVTMQKAELGVSVGGLDAAALRATSDQSHWRMAVPVLCSFPEDVTN